MATLTVQQKYRAVTDTLKILQINENAICDEVLKHMNESIAFEDADKSLGEKIYYGRVFEDILERCTNNEITIPAKFHSHLTDMIALAELYQYVMVLKV